MCRCKVFFRRLLAVILVVPGMLLLPVQLHSQSAPATPGILQGLITNGSNGVPVTGAKVVVNGAQAWSTSGGLYTLSIDPVGTYQVSATKPGFENYLSAPVLFQPGGMTLLNIPLWENLTPPSGVFATIDTISQYIPVSWSPPVGNYELLYDDGIQDNFAVWFAGGNMNAVKFSPLGFPFTLTGGSVHIGSSSNYPAGSTPLTPFQVMIFDATGTGGTPGNNIAGPVNVIPQAFGWVEFSLPVPLTLNGGAFFIAMVQGGNSPNTPGISIDETNPQFRSCSRFVTGGGPWVPAGGNFMIRAKCIGPGGPAYLSDEPLITGLSNVYRLRQGEEQNPTAWSLVGATNGSGITDSSWSSLPCGPYRWGVKSQYTGNRWSPVTFSNILGKCWTSPVHVHIELSCETGNSSGLFIKLVNQVYPDTIYSAAPDTNGNVLFPHVWKGTYKLTATRFGYDTLNQIVPVAAPVSLDLILLQITSPPANLVVNDSSLMARWDVPHFEKLIFSENWNSGSFALNSWTLEGGTNWTISTGFGNPFPSAMFASLPQQTNYSQSLVSKTITGQHATLLKLKYDILLDNFGNTTVNEMAVEIWDGSVWHALKTYSNTGGNIAWTREDIDISTFAGTNFRIRFNASGGDSQDINNWNLDNINVVASEPAQEQANCILGYYFYLDNVISGYTTKNAYPIPGNQVQYGQTYHACVRALYGSGYSDSTCTEFESKFLYPVINLHGNQVENTAYIAWEKPLASTDTSVFIPPGLVGYVITRDDSVIGTIANADSLSFYDDGLEPGYYQYGVAAVYDLAPYGFPGQVGESLPAGPLHITINWGRQLPFFESWNSGTFAFNDWQFTPSQGNWVIEPNEGIPSPAANFKWQPPVINYNFSLESPAFNGLSFNCAAIWLDFDLKLNDRNYTGTEKMVVEAYYNNAWHRKAEIKNTGSIQWTNYHIDISPARGKGFRVRFTASGQNSSEILNWYLDNVNIYPICYPVVNLAGEALANNVRLTWSPPACYGGNLLNEGFEETSFPPTQWTKQSNNPAATWMHATSSGLPGVHNGVFSAGIDWDYNHQDEWLIAHDIYVNGNLTFWSYAFQGSLHQDHYYLKVSADQGNTWDILLDMSALPPYPSTSGINDWVTPYHADLSAYAGETVDIAWQAVDGDGNGLWYPWAIDDCSIGADDKMSPGDVIGYNIYRRGTGSNTFLRINAGIVNDTVYVDEGLPFEQFRYFIQPQFSECQNATNSDTIMIDVLTGMDVEHKLNISVFPNPATDHVTIDSQTPIQEVCLFDFSGKISGKWMPRNELHLTIGSTGFAPGIYLLKIQTACAVKNFKICIQ